MVFWGKGGFSNTHLTVFSYHYYYLEELLTYRTQPLSLFPGTVVCSEKQMTVYWTRNVIISFLSPRCGSREDTGHCRGFFLLCKAMHLALLHMLCAFLYCTVFCYTMVTEL